MQKSGKPAEPDKPAPHLSPSEAGQRLADALNLISRYGGIDGAHHKQWVLDQLARIITGDHYPEWVAHQKAGEMGPESYEWDEGIAP